MPLERRIIRSNENLRTPVKASVTKEDKYKYAASAGAPDVAAYVTFIIPSQASSFLLKTDASCLEILLGCECGVQRNLRAVQHVTFLLLTAELFEGEQGQESESDYLRYMEPEPDVCAALPDELTLSIVGPDTEKEEQIGRDMDGDHGKNGVVQECECSKCDAY